MNRRRTFMAFLLTLALPYAAAASIGEGLRCHHAGTDAPVSVAPSLPHDHGHTAQAHHDAGRAGHDSCDCPVNCDCAQHCAGTGCGAVLPLQLLEPAAAGGTAARLAGYAALIREAWHSPAFRPPIAAPPSAA